MLKIRNFSVHYGRVVAVDHVHLSLTAGEIGIIRGEFGGGKSSLLKAIFGNVRHLGDLYVDGRTVRKPYPKLMAKRGGALMHENAEVFKQLTVRENIAVTQPQSLDAAHLTRTLEQFPSLSKHLDSPAFMLSGGQRQMLAFIRAVASRPKLLLLDEPNTGIAAEVTEAIKKIIRGLANMGTAILITEQTPALTTVATQHWNMLNGKILTGDTL